MPFDPTLPVDADNVKAFVLRGQFNGLKELIDAIPAGPPGPPGSDGAPGTDGAPGATGPAGPPFASVVVDGVDTLPAGSAATVTAVLVGDVVHLTFGIPTGVEGPMGEVSLAQLNAAIAAALADRPTVTEMDQAIDAAVADRPTTAQMNATIGASLADRPTTAQVNDIAAAAVSDRATNAQLSTAIADVQTAAAANSSANSNAVPTLDTPFADPDAETLRQSFNALVLALRRP